MSCLQNEALLETIYDEVWEEFRTGVIQQIEDETNKRFED